MIESYNFLDSSKMFSRKFWGVEKNWYSLRAYSYLQMMKYSYTIFRILEFDADTFNLKQIYIAKI